MSTFPLFSKLLSWLRTLEENIRFRIIYQLDKLDKWCWADLVMWALRYRPFDEVGPVRQCLRHDGPYCGKCEKFIPPEGRSENLNHPV
jgi:hypothetical protein